MRRLKLGMEWLLGALFILGGINHFRMVDSYMKIMPPYLPWHLELVYLSGVLEVLLGVMLLVSAVLLLDKAGARVSPAGLGAVAVAVGLGMLGARRRRQPTRRSLTASSAAQ